MSDGRILFSVHGFLDCLGSPLFVLSFFDSVANIGDGSGMPGEPVLQRSVWPMLGRGEWWDGRGGRKQFGNRWTSVQGGEICGADSLPLDCFWELFWSL